MIPTLIALVSFLVLTTVFSWRWHGVRTGRVTTIYNHSLGATVMPYVETGLHQASGQIQDWFKSAFFHVLVFLREILLFFKFVIVRLEKRFSHVIDSVKGKGLVTKRGSTSIFLNEIKNHRDEIRSQRVV